MQVDIVGVNEIALLAGVSKQVVINWRNRFSDFPKPVAVLASGPVFSLLQIKKWLRRRKIKMAHVISTINLKGGVGKTTTTVALAEVLSAEMRKKVLVIDLDPQTNATVMLIGEPKWKQLNAREHTLARLFKDSLNPDDKKFNLEKALQKNVSNVKSTIGIDLLPSSLDLIDVQDRLATVPSGRYYSVNPIEILWRSVKSIIDEYDVVIVDCPPNLGIITLNGLRISHGYIIPTIPDILSTYGIPQILKRVRGFSDEIAEEVTPFGIIITKYQANSTVHNATLNGLKTDPKLPKIYDTVIPQANQFAQAAEFTTRLTFKQKWGYQGLAEKFELLANEILVDLEG